MGRFNSMLAAMINIIKFLLYQEVSRISNDEAISIAKKEADNNNWNWIGTVDVSYKRTFIGKIRQIVVRTNSGAIGCNVIVGINYIDGKIIKSGFLRR
jgi:hypothetical protein